MNAEELAGYAGKLAAIGGTVALLGYTKKTLLGKKSKKKTDCIFDF